MMELAKKHTYDGSLSDESGSSDEDEEPLII